MEEKEQIKITCLDCGKTGNYKVKPNFCAYCGISFQNQLESQNKLIQNHNTGNI
jgi:ribosomal protein L37E